MRFQEGAQDVAATGADAAATAEIQSALAEAGGKVVEWGRGLVESIPNMVAALLVLLIFWGLARIARSLTRDILRRFAQQPEVIRLIAAAVYLLVLAIGLVLALGVLNLDRTVTSLLAGAGILGLALGFAFQDIAENFMAGIILNVRHQFSEGDIVETNDIMGIVERVEMRATVLRTFAGQRALIPNADVFKSSLVNYSQTGVRRVDIAVGVAYGDDLEVAKRVAIDAVQGIASRLTDREVELFYEEFGDSSINFQLRFWIPFEKQTDFLAARSEAIMRIKKAFEESGITIPFPIRTLDFAGGVVGGQGLVEVIEKSGMRG